MMEKIERPVSEKVQHKNINSSSPVVNSDLSQKLLTKNSESECGNYPKEKEFEKENSGDPRTDCEALETFSARNEAETNESPAQRKGVTRIGDSLESSTVLENQKQVLPHSSEGREKNDPKAVNQTIVNISSPPLFRRSDEEPCNEDIESNKAQASSKAIQNEIDSARSYSKPAGEDCCKQQSTDGSKENKAEFVKVADGSESSPALVNGTEKQTTNGSNKENENNAMALNVDSAPSLANLAKEKVVITSGNQEADENDSLNNSGDENALVIDDRPEQDSESPLPLAQQSAKTLPASSPQVAPKAPAKSVKGRKAGNSRQPPKFDKEDLEHLRLPEKYGWKRELVFRGTFDQESRKMDIYYHPPSGRKLRSMMDIGSYLDKQVQYPLNRTHFTFRKEKLFEPPFEIVRSAGQPVKAFSSPSLTSKSNGSPTSITPSSRRVAVKVTTPKTSKPTPGVKQTFPGKYINRPERNVAPKASESRAGLIPSAQQGNSIQLKTNGAGSTLTQLAREALQQSLSPSNQGGGLYNSSSSQTTSLQPNSQQSQPKTGFGLGLKSSKSSSNGASKDRPAVSWKMKVTPRTNNKKNRPRPSSPDWKPSDEESSSSDSADNEEEENVEIIRHGVGDADGDEMQRVMGPASDLIASIVQQSQPKSPRTTSYSIPITTVNTGSGNKNLMPRLSTSSMQSPRTKLAISTKYPVIKEAASAKSQAKGKKFKQYSKQSMRDAVEAVKGGISVQQAAKEFGVPRTTLSDISKERYSVDTLKTALRPNDEAKVVSWLLESGKKGCAFNRELLFLVIQSILNREKRITKLKDNKPKAHWLAAFLKRHPEVREMKKKVLNQHQVHLTEENIHAWFGKVEAILAEDGVNIHTIPPSQVFNADETCITLCPSGQVVMNDAASKHFVRSYIDSQITILGSASAAGQLLPPMVIYPGKNIAFHKEEDFPEAICKQTEKGLINTSIFQSWLEDTFIPNTKDLLRPVVLFCDGHSNHVSLDVHEICKANGIIYYLLPRFASHIVQPLDLVFYGQFKHEWKSALKFNKVINGVVSVTAETFMPVFRNAWQRSYTPDSLRTAFKKCGLSPWCPDAVNYKKCERRAYNLSHKTETEEQPIMCFLHLPKEADPSQFSTNEGDLHNKKDSRVMIIQNPSHSINTNVPLQSVMSRSLLHSSSVPSNLPIQIFPGGYGPTQTSAISDISTGTSSIFPPPPPLASCPTLRSADLPPLRAVGLNPPPLMSMPPPPLLAGPRAPPALQPCPLLLDGNVRFQTPGQMAMENQSHPPPAPPPLAHRSFTPNILQRHGSQKSPQKSGLVPAQVKDTERIEERDIVQVDSRPDEGKKSNRLPKVIPDIAEVVVSSEEEGDNVQCVAKSSQAERKNLALADKKSSQRKRQTPSFSNSSDEEGPNQATHHAKRMRLEKRKSPEPVQANVKALEAVRNLVVNRAGKEDDNEGNRELTQSSTALRNILNKPPKSKNSLPEVNDVDEKAGEEEDDDDEFLPPVSFAPEATRTESPQSLSLLNETDGAEQPVNSTSSFTPSLESTNTQSTSSAASSKSSDSNELALPLGSSHVPLKTNTSNAQLLTLPSALREKLDLNRPLLLSLNGQDITIPPAHVLDTKDSLKVLLPPGTNMSVSGPAKTLSVAVSNLATPSSSSTPPPKLTRGFHLRSSFRPLQGSVGIMTRLFKFFSIPYLLKISQVNKTWLKMFYQPDLWQTVSFRNVYVKDWDQAQRFLQKVCVKKLSLSGMILRRDIEAESWQRIQKIVPVVTTLTELHFGRVPANVIEGLMEKLPETVNISADLIMDSKSKENKSKMTSNRWSEKHVDNMASALTSVGSGMSSTNAARLFNVAESDLLHLRQDRMYVLTPEEESLVVLCCMRLAQMGFIITISSFLIKCQEMFARRYSTSVPVPIFDGACREIFQRNLPFFHCDQGFTASLPLSLDRHYIKLGNLFDNICRPLKITADQIYMFDIQPFRLLADSHALSRRGVVTLTVLWATDAGSLSVRPAMLVTPTELRSDQTHEKFKAVVAKNGVATPTHIQQYFRQLIASAGKFPLVVLCNTDASNFSESLVSMCLQHQVYLMNIPGDIAKFVFPGCQGGLIHMLKKQVPLMSMRQEEFLSQLKLLFQKCLLNVQMSTKLAFTATGVFPVNRRAPVQYQSHGTPESISEVLVPAAKTDASRSTTTDITVPNVQPVKILSKASELEDSSSAFDESGSCEEEVEKNENKKSAMSDSSFSDNELIEESKKSSIFSCRPSTLMSKKKCATEVLQEKNKSSAPQVQSSKKDESKAAEKNHAKDKYKKESKLENVKKTRFSTKFLFVRKLILKARRGPIKLSTHKYEPLKPLTSVLPPRDIQKSVDGNNVISTLAVHTSAFETHTQHKNSSFTANLPNKESSAEGEPKDLVKEPSSLVIDTAKVEEKRSKKSQKSVGVEIKQGLALSPSKNKALVRKHIQEAIDAVVEESREYARQVERGGKHGVEIMPEKWMQRQREKQAAFDLKSANLNSAYVKKVGGTSIVLKTSGIAELEKKQDEEEESEEEEEEDEEVEEDDADEDEAASSYEEEEEEEEEEVETGVVWTVSTQPKHVEVNSTRKKHKKRKKRNKRKHYDSDDEIPAKDRENRHKKKRSKKAKKKKKHKKKKSKSDPEDMEDSHEVSPQKQVLNGTNTEVGAIKNIPSIDDLDSNDKAVLRESLVESEDGHKRTTDETVCKLVFQQQPSYISDHDYFSRFVDEDSVNMEETDLALPSGAEEMNMLDGVSASTIKVALEHVPANVEASHQTSTEHDYSKAAEEVLDISGQDVEVEMVEEENSETPKEMTTQDSSDSESDSDNASGHKSSPGNSSDSSKSSSSTGTANEESSEDESDDESEQNKSSVSQDQGSSPKTKVRKESLSDSSGSDSSDSDSESEKDEKKKKASTSLESDEENDDSDEEEEEEDKCQLCMRSTPPHSKDVLIDWVDCDKNCGRWFHVICIKNSNFRSKSKSKNPKHYICPSCR